jgi:hypothetical protein
MWELASLGGADLKVTTRVHLLNTHKRYPWRDLRRCAAKVAAPSRSPRAAARQGPVSHRPSLPTRVSHAPPPPPLLN